MNLRRALSSLVRQPVFHFLLIAVAIGVIHNWLYAREVDREERTIRVTATDIERLAAEWTARWSRPPTTEELEGLLAQRVREAALYRQAMAMGLNEDDTVIQRVLVQKLETLVRGLVEVSLSPTDQDLQTYFAENAERYRPPPVITFTHVFIDPDKREERTLADAAEILAELEALGAPPEDIGRFGDRFMLQLYYPEKDEQRIGSLFGREFARSVFELEPGLWHGPVLSGYGTHLVFVEARTEFPVPDLAEIKERVTEEWIAAKREEITTRYFADLLDRYEVEIERAPSGEGGAQPAAEP